MTACPQLSSGSRHGRATHEYTGSGRDKHPGGFSAHISARTSGERAAGGKNIMVSDFALDLWYEGRDE